MTQTKKNTENRIMETVVKGYDHAILSVSM